MLTDQEESVIFLLRKAWQIWTKIESWDGGSANDSNRFRDRIHELQDIVATRAVYRLVDKDLRKE
jgi:DNA-directed RNA polymerase subunit F